MGCSRRVRQGVSTVLPARVMGAEGEPPLRQPSCPSHQVGLRQKFGLTRIAFSRVSAKLTRLLHTPGFGTFGTCSPFSPPPVVI